MRIGIALACAGMNGQQSTTYDWFETQESLDAINYRIRQMASESYSLFDLEEPMKHASRPDTYMFALVIAESDQDLFHWFRFRQTAIGQEQN